MYVGCWYALALYLRTLVRRGMDRRSFAVLALLTSTFLFTFIGGAVEAEPVGVMFWCLAAIIPALGRQHHGRRVQLASELQQLPAVGTRNAFGVRLWLSE